MAPAFAAIRRRYLAPTVMLVIALYSCGGSAEDIPEQDSASASPSARSSQSPSASSASPTADPASSTARVPLSLTQYPGPSEATSYPALDPEYPGPLRPGDWVQLKADGGCLSVRYSPEIPPSPAEGGYSNVRNCLPDGFVGRLNTPPLFTGRPTVPVSANGTWWWHIVGQGWAPEERLTFHHQGDLPWPERPDLENAGVIAYGGPDGGVWLMNADGRGRRQIVASPGDNKGIGSFRWSPSGDRISYTIRRPGKYWTPFIASYIVDPAGTLVAEYPGLSDIHWSPAGDRISAIREEGEHVPPAYGVPVVLDLSTGGETRLGPVAWNGIAPIWSPDGNSLAYVCASITVVQPDGSTIVDPRYDCGGDGLRIVSADGSASRVLLPVDDWTQSDIRRPSWSPSGTMIAVSLSGSDCPGYTILDAGSGSVEGCISVAGGAGLDMAWAPDGTHFIAAPQGLEKTGLVIYDLATGAQTHIPSMEAWFISWGPGGREFAFASDGHIWVVGLDGSNLTLLAQGHLPAWQPRP